jgi:hypothetical protein
VLLGGGELAVWLTGWLCDAGLIVATWLGTDEEPPALPVPELDELIVAGRATAILTCGATADCVARLAWFETRAGRVGGE